MSVEDDRRSRAASDEPLRRMRRIGIGGYGDFARHVRSGNDARCAIGLYEIYQRDDRSRDLILAAIARHEIGVQRLRAVTGLRSAVSYRTDAQVEPDDAHDRREQPV